MLRPRLAGGTLVMSTPSISMCPLVTSSSPAIRRSKVDLPQPDGPTNTTNSPSPMSRSIDGMMITSPNALRTPLIWILPMMSPDHFTAPKVRPRTSCFCENQPSTRIGAMARVEAADSLAQNRPSGLE